MKPEPTDKPQPPQDVFVAKDLLGCGGKTAIKPYKELKPCPFCFGQACLHRRRSVNNAVGNAKTGWVYHVHCIGCGAHFHEDGNEPSAISRWNTGDRFVGPTPRAQALIFQPELTHSVWTDVMHRKRSRKSLEAMLRKGVRSGEYVGYRLLNIEAEYIGVSWPNGKS